MTGETTTFPPCPQCGELLPLATRFEASQLGTPEGKASKSSSVPAATMRDLPGPLPTDPLPLQVLFSDEPRFPWIGREMLPALGLD